MKESTRTFAPVVAVIFLFAAAHWVVAEPAGQGMQDQPVTGTVSAPFEYFPAQFVNQGTESGEHIATF